MDFLADMASLRFILAFGGLGLLLWLEWWGPFRVPVEGKPHHVATNLTIGGSNAVIVNLLLGGLLLAWSDRADRAGWGLLHELGLGPISKIAVSVVVLDLVFYVAHWANHHVPVLWRFHRAHHSDLDLDVTTALRFHIGEVLISTGIKVVAIPTLGISALGLVVFEMALLAAAQLQHSNLKLPEPVENWFRLLIVTPRMHWIHHSRHPREHNANFGTIFSGWDRLIGTYFMQVRQEEIRVGLDEYPSPEHVGLLWFYAMPVGAGCQRSPHGP